MESVCVCVSAYLFILQHKPFHWWWPISNWHTEASTYAHSLTLAPFLHHCRPPPSSSSFASSYSLFFCMLWPRDLCDHMTTAVGHLTAWKPTFHFPAALRKDPDHPYHCYTPPSGHKKITPPPCPALLLSVFVLMCVLLNVCVHRREQTASLRGGWG